MRAFKTVYRGNQGTMAETHLLRPNEYEQLYFLFFAAPVVPSSSSVGRRGTLPCVCGCCPTPSSGANLHPRVSAWMQSSHGDTYLKVAQLTSPSLEEDPEQRENKADLGEGG